MDQKKSSLDTLAKIIFAGVFGVFLAAFSGFMEPYQGKLLKITNYVGVFYLLLFIILEVLLYFYYRKSSSIPYRSRLMKLMGLVALLFIVGGLGLYMVNYVFL